MFTCDDYITLAMSNVLYQQRSLQVIRVVSIQESLHVCHHVSVSKALNRLKNAAFTVSL